MSQHKTPEKKKSRLSLSKTKKGSALVTASPSKSSASPSIVTLFQNAPPPKLSCPLCGQMVPRFGLNRHIDEACPKAKEENDDVILVGDTVSRQTTSTSPQVPLKPKTSIARGKDKADPGIQDQVKSEHASPYFAKNVSIKETCKDLDATVPLGSLSSKLCRRHLSRKAKKDVSRDFARGGVHPDDNNKSHTRETSEPQVQGDTCSSDVVTLSSSPDSINEVYKTQKCSQASGDGADFPPSNADVGSSERPDCVTDKKLDSSKRKQSEGFLVLENSSKKMKCSNSLETISDLTDENREHGDPGRVTSIEDNSDILPVEDPNVLDEFLKPFNDSESNVEAGDSDIKDPSIQPYYLRNFLMVLQTVMENEEDMSLFSEEDTLALTTFCQLSAGGQKLYVRLFQRKLNWIKVNKIEYSEIGSNLIPFIEELSRHGFLQTDSDLEELSEALDLLPAPELKILAKTFHLASPTAQKHQLVEEFLKLSRQRSIFMSKNQSSIGAAILKKAKEAAGRAVRVCKGPRAVFSRVLLLFSLTESMDVEEAASGGQTLLSTVLMVNMGRMTYPQYTVQRNTRIFQDREDLIRYESAMHKLIDIVVTMTNGNWKEAHLIFQSAQEDWEQLKNDPTLRYHTELPLFLRCFTVGWVYTRILSRGVEILQRLHLYEEAVQILQTLLSQTVYCPDSRGRWWDRLVLNLHQHLKCAQKAIPLILEGLSDPYVRTGHKLSLYQRAVRMRDSPSCKKFRNMFNELPEMNVEDVPHVTIKGKMYPQTGMGKSVFLMENLAEEAGGEITLSTVMCSVEELALAHYRGLGFDQGIHGEGSTFSTLYGLFMWDIIFMEGIPDVFRNSYQAFPLDLHTDSFYENRKDAIENRLQLLQASPAEILDDMMADVWNAHLGESAALVVWERFSSLQQAQGLVSCLGGPILSGICRIMSKDIRHSRGGLPDLVVWNVQKKTSKLVEVKGPNDRLSQKQMVWLHELRKMGADVEVCHVVSIGAKSNRLN